MRRRDVSYLKVGIIKYVRETIFSSDQFANRSGLQPQYSREKIVYQAYFIIPILEDTRSNRQKSSSGGNLFSKALGQRLGEKKKKGKRLPRINSLQHQTKVLI